MTLRTMQPPRTRTLAASAPVRSRRQWPLVLGLYLLGILHWLGFMYVVAPSSGQERALVAMLRHPSTLIKAPSFALEQGWFINDSWFVHRRVLDAVQLGLRTLTVPYHVPGLAVWGVTSPSPEPPISQRLFSLPTDWPLSPQLVLLAVMDPARFIVVNWLLLYTVGVLGCLAIARAYRLGDIALAWLFVLFHFNGFITGHMTIRMGDDAGYFLMPLVVLLVLKAGEAPSRSVPAVEDERARQWRIGLWLGLVLGIVWLQGSAHAFIEWIAFLMVWAVVNRRRWRIPLAAALAGFGICAVRFLPAAVQWGMTTRAQSLNPALGGYWAPDDYVRALSVASAFNHTAEDWGLYNLYVSLPGMLAVLVLAVWGPWTRASWVRTRGLKALAWPTLIVAAMSFRRVKALILPPWVPFFSAEAWTSRFMMIPLVIGIVVAAINVQGVVEERWADWRIRTMVLGGLGVTTLALLNHSRLWRLWLAVGASTPWDASRLPAASIANDLSDTVYIASVQWGALVSCLSLAAVIALLWLGRSRRAGAQT